MLLISVISYLKCVSLVGQMYKLLDISTVHWIILWIYIFKTHKTKLGKELAEVAEYDIIKKYAFVVLIYYLISLKQSELIEVPAESIILVHTYFHFYVTAER